MKRRRFLQMSIVAEAFARTAQSQNPERSGPASKSAPMQIATPQNSRSLGGRFDCKVSGKDTGGDLCIYDTIRAAKGGPALHRHHFQDEWFYVIRGEFIVQVGDDALRLRPGDSALAPRKIPHAFAKVSDDEGQMLVLFQPAGSMEDFFEQLGKIGKEIPKNQETKLKQLWADHGMEILGPPLKF